MKKHCCPRNRLLVQAEVMVPAGLEHQGKRMRWLGQQSPSPAEGSAL